MPNSTNTASSTPASLGQWRARVLATAVSFVARWGVLAWAPSALMALHVGLWGVALVDTLAFAAVLLLWRW